MLPAVAKDVLSSNPNFDALYRDLCVNKLNANATTKIDPKVQKERNAFDEELRRARNEAAKRNVIKFYLDSLSYRGDQLPAELQELVAIIAAGLQSQIPKEDAGLLQEDTDRFRDSVKPIAKEIWKAALDDLVTLARISSPQGHSDGDDLPARVQRQRYDIGVLEESIAAARLDLAHEVTNVHTLYRKAIETCIRILEQVIHGSVSRSTKSKAEYCQIVAEGMSKKLHLQHAQLLSQTRSPELEEALQTHSEYLDRESLSYKRRIREVEEQLAAHQKGPNAIRGISAEYSDILRETAKLKADIARLENR